MIVHLRGEVSEKGIGRVVLDVGGVGYEVLVPVGDLDKLLVGDRVKLFTYHIVREQSEELVGFLTLAGKALFELLITVQGVGPKAAMAILSLGEAEMVRNAIANEDARFVAQAAGVGKKTADLVIAKLKDRVGLATAYEQKGQLSMTDGKDEAVEALMALGYSVNDAARALDGVDSKLSVEERVRLALRG